ncbi:uncharacterized protein B0T15DRAFT_529562 [Chaetomium strumarium]|uniref:Uncharacterized protein n=1 Tax=Chaetomium strumarium TaxID=1170767 RepID=A0AAJ0GW05_9PEZI|nr:hypothetical protein B0T15DRAFT_529562 [Chaetomium strumarium]
MPFDKLLNGNWRFNHPCAGGAFTKASRPYAHRCCKEGNKKPPIKQRTKRQWEEAKDMSDAKQIKRPRDREQ